MVLCEAEVGREEDAVGVVGERSYQQTLLVSLLRLSLRLIDLPVPARACQSSLGPLSVLWKVKLCQFSAYLVFVALFLLVEGSEICPRIHLFVGGSSSGKLVKAMK